MDAAVIAARQERDGLAGQAQRDFPGFSVPAGGEGDREEQSDPAWMGEVLRDRPLEPVFLIHPILGRKEDSAPSRPSVPTRWSREWLYKTLGLFSEYRVCYAPSLSAVAPV